MSGAPAFMRPMPVAARARLSVTGRLFISVLLVLVLEGAIRKWVSDSSTLPLILLRDLLACCTVVRAITHGHFRRQRHLAQLMVGWSACTLGWGLLQLTLGESNFAVLLIGLRFWLLYFWFALAAAVGMTERDYVVALRVLMAALVLMVPLAVVQRNSPPTALINKSLEGDESDIFLVIAGVVRTTGTFSFTTGFSLFIHICAPFALGAFEARKRRIWQRLLAVVVFGSLVVCTLVSGARGSFLYTGGMFALFLLGNLLFAPVRRKGIALVGALLAVLAVAGLSVLMQDSVDAIQERFQVASESEDLASRMLTVVLGEPGILRTIDWLGAGIGIGSNLAQFVQSGGRPVFVYGETETARTLVEGGLAGVLFILFKLFLIFSGTAVALKRSMQTRAIFPLLVWASLTLALLTWPAIGQLTAHGMLGILFALGLLCLRYPTLRLFG